MERASKSLQFMALLLLGGFLVFLAYPRLHAALVYLPVDTAIKKYYDTLEVPAGQLEGLQQRAEDAIGILPHYRYWEGLSLLLHLQAADSGNPLYQRRQAFEAAIEAAETSLGHAPAQPRTWLRIAQARAWLRYPPADVIAAYEMAVLTGRVEPSMFSPRLTLGLAYLPRMDAAGRAMVRDQLLLAWGMRRQDVVRALKAGELSLSDIAPLLEGAHQDVLDEIEEAAGGAAR